MRRCFFFLLFMSLFARSADAQVARRVAQSGTVTGKLFYQAKGNYPASNATLVLMPNTKMNLSLAQDSNQPFDDKTINSLYGARRGGTSSDGSYQFSSIAPGNYILRVAGR